MRLAGASFVLEAGRGPARYLSSVISTFSVDTSICVCVLRLDTVMGVHPLSLCFSLSLYIYIYIYLSLYLSGMANA